MTAPALTPEQVLAPDGNLGAVQWSARSALAALARADLDHAAGIREGEARERARVDAILLAALDFDHEALDPRLWLNRYVDAVRSEILGKPLVEG